MPFESKQSFKGRRIAFFEPNRDFVSNPTLNELFRRFVDSEAFIDIYAPPKSALPLQDTYLQTFSFPYYFRLWNNGFYKTYHNWKYSFQNWSMSRDRKLRNTSYDLIFGIDSEGVIAAHRHAISSSTPYIYLSFEIFFSDELKFKADLIEKQNEIRACRDVDLVIVQDPLRGNLISKENNIPKSKLTYLPVAPSINSPNHINYHYLRERFSIPTDKYILLHSGSFDQWTYADELIFVMERIPEHVVLVLHTHSSAPSTRSYLNRIKKCRFRNVILSTEMLDPEKYESLVASADIGLVLYKPIDTGIHSKYLQKNIQHIGLASGKFSYYMKYGLPVISVGQKYYDHLLDRYEFGVNINNLSQITMALNAVTTGYDRMHQNALSLFNKELKFETHWPDLRKKLVQLLRSPV